MEEAAGEPALARKKSRDSIETFNTQYSEDVSPSTRVSQDDPMGDWCF